MNDATSQSKAPVPMGATALLAGSIGAQVIAALLLLTCLPRYGFAAFGTVATYLLARNLLSHMAILKSCNVILRSPATQTRDSAIATGLIANLTISVSAMVLTLALCYAGVITDLGIWLWLGPTLLAGGIYDLLTAITMQAGRPSVVALARCVLALAVGLTQLGLSFVQPTAGSIAASYFCGFAAGSVCLFRIESLKGAISVFRTSTFRTFQPNRADGVFGSGIGMLDTLNHYGIPAIIQVCVGSGAAGYYVAASRLILTPVQLMAQAHAHTLQAWAPKASQLQINRYLYRLAGGWGLVTLAGAVFAYPFFAIAAEDVFGSKWTDTATLMAAMMLTAPIPLLCRPLDAVAISRRHLAGVLSVRVLVLIAGALPIALAGSQSNSLSPALYSIASTATAMAIAAPLLALRFRLLTGRAVTLVYGVSLLSAALVLAVCVENSHTHGDIVPPTSGRMITAIMLATGGCLALITTRTRRHEEWNTREPNAPAAKHLER